MRKNSIKKILTIVISYLVMLSVITMLKGACVEAKTKTVEGTRVMNLKQNIKGKEYYIGCRMEECDKHNGKLKYSEKPCASGSDLKNIYVEKKDKNEKSQWKTLDELKFKSIQGGCINNDILLLAFVDKGRNNKGDLTALVKINIKTNKVVKVELVKGASELNIDTLGHSNDFTYLNGRYYGAWYQENGKENYSNRVGTINEELKGKGKIGELKKEKRAAVFGISVFDKKQEIFAMGIRQKININGKDGLKRYIATYKSKKEKDGTKYVKQSRIITLRKNNDYNVPQCMEIYNKKIYLIKYFSKGKKKGKKIKKIEKRVKYKNNVVEIYDFNGKLKREYIIKNPKKTYVSQTEKDEYGNSKENKIVRPLGKFEWEIESLSHYKKNTFYYVMYKPSASDKENIGKQAYLYKVNLK